MKRSELYDFHNRSFLICFDNPFQVAVYEATHNGMIMRLILHSTNIEIIKKTIREYATRTFGK